MENAAHSHSSDPFWTRECSVPTLSSGNARGGDSEMIEISSCVQVIDLKEGVAVPADSRGPGLGWRREAGMDDLALNWKTKRD